MEEGEPLMELGPLWEAEESLAVGDMCNSKTVSLKTVCRLSVQSVMNKPSY